MIYGKIRYNQEKAHERWYQGKVLRYQRSEEGAGRVIRTVNRKWTSNAIANEMITGQTMIYKTIYIKLKYSATQTII